MEASTNNITGAVTAIVIGAGHAGLAISRCLENRTLGFVALVNTQLAKPVARLSLQRQRPGRVHVDARDCRIYRRVRQCDSCANKNQNHGDFGAKDAHAIGSAMPTSIQSLTPMGYRNPDHLSPGGVLVVGASASGLQLAQEIQRSGRQVTLAVGDHVRMPRTYRGRDIQWWMDRAGFLDQRIEDESDVLRARRLPSPQLIGSPDRATLDLNALQTDGVAIAGRLAGIRDGKAQFSGSLRNCCALADLKLNRLLEAFDTWSRKTDRYSEFEAPERPVATDVATRPLLNLDLGGKAIHTVIWATGYRADYSWLHVPVLDRKGKLCHERGVVGTPGIPTPGLYAMGLSFMRRRKSSFIYGAAADAHDICNHLVTYLDQQARRNRSRAVVPVPLSDQTISASRVDWANNTTAQRLN